MKPRQQAAEEEVPFQIAPMIDIVFQLLIFFIMTMKLQELDFVKEVILPVADAAQQKQTDGMLEIRINVLNDGRIIVGNQEYKTEELAAGLRKEFGEGESGSRKILIRGDNQAHYGKIMRIMAACAQADLWNVAFSAYEEDRSQAGQQ